MLNRIESAKLNTYLLYPFRAVPVLRISFRVTYGTLYRIVCHYDEWCDNFLILVTNSHICISYDLCQWRVWKSGLDLI